MHRSLSRPSGAMRVFNVKTRCHGKLAALQKTMIPTLEALVHLASVIDMKEEKLESALTTARREQLSRQIEIVSEMFAHEYEVFTTADAKNAAAGQAAR